MSSPALAAAALPLLILLAALPSAQAAGAGQSVPGLTAPAGSWRELTPAQREALAPLETEWPRIDTIRRDKWLELAGRFPTMPVEERERIQARMRSWAQLSTKERNAARMHFQEFRQMSPDERRARWEAYRELPEEQRRSLAERAAPVPAGTASTPRAAAGRAASAEPVAKSNTVPGITPTVNLRPVTPAMLQVKPGATTTLINRTPIPPGHLSPGQPKIAATREDVDPRTLLPLPPKPKAAPTPSAPLVEPLPAPAQEHAVPTLEAAP